MNFSLKAKNTTLTPALEAYVEEKLVRMLGRILGKTNTSAAKLVVEVGRSTRHHKKGEVWQAKATVAMGAKTNHAEATGESAREAIDLLEEELKREVVAFKEKSIAVKRRGERKFKKELTLAKEAKFPKRARVREEGI